MFTQKYIQAKKLMDSIISAGAAHTADFTSYSITVIIIILFLSHFFPYIYFMPWQWPKQSNNQVKSKL